MSTTKISGDTTPIKSQESPQTTTSNDKNNEMEIPPEIWQRLQNVLWRDFVFLILGGIALNIIGYIETHANDTDIRGGGGSGVLEEATNGCRNTAIVDAGFLLTAPLHAFLSNNRDWNDALACINSLILFVPAVYAAKITLWRGDYTLSFRLIAMYLFRSFCGWFTYLPPDPSFLMSYYDFPEVVQCLYKDCSADPTENEVLPFVSFFSGHVACTVIAANHMYLCRETRRAAVILHILNVLQMVRLLATRGHYSIDIIIGWAVAVYVSNPAERLGLYYTRGVTLKQLLLPKDVKKTLETITGVSEISRNRRGRIGRKRSVLFDSVKNIEGEILEQELGGRESLSPARTLRSETTANLAAEIATKFAQKKSFGVTSRVESNWYSCTRG
mmetsp:Transcript_6814/g.10018  ORF Transcript_6814/g.10018 Transcript_6814/m.10018 type:complete len:387 (-) Transcript_6814:554-1714(-)